MIKADDGAIESQPRPIWLCADDYGMAPGVSRGIRDLVQRGRLNATSAMTVATSLDRSEADALNALNAHGRRVAIGLHVTLTAPFRPLSAGFRPLRDGAFLPLNAMGARGVLRRLSRPALEAEIAAQLQAFADLFGRLPDFIDGHQHAHLFPQVREALLAVAKRSAPGAWIRQCGRVSPLAQRFADPKGLVLDLFSRKFRKLADAAGVETNPAFAGTYNFTATPAPDFAQLFPAFLERLPANSVVMCHPGFVDAELTRLDPLTTMREREHAYFAGDAFLPLIHSRGLTLA